MHTQTHADRDIAAAPQPLTSGEPDLRPKQRRDLRTQVVEGEVVVLDRREEFVHQFNATASYIWERCNGLYTPEEITQQLCQAFEVDYPTARKDVLATVEQMQRAKLLEAE